MKSLTLGVFVAALLVALGWWALGNSSPAPAPSETADTQALAQPAVLTKDIVFDGHVLEKVGDAPYYGVEGQQLKVHVDKVINSKGANISGDVIITTVFKNIIVGSTTLTHEFTADLNHTTGWYEVTKYRGITTPSAGN